MRPGGQHPAADPPPHQPNDRGSHQVSAPTGEEAAAPVPAAGPADPTQLLRERSYLVLLLLGALVGVPVAAVAYGFLGLTTEGQEWVYDSLPGELGFDGTP